MNILIKQQTNLVAGERKQVKTCSNTKIFNNFKVFGQQKNFNLRRNLYPAAVTICCMLL